jgi:hypothetical protein
MRASDPGDPEHTVEVYVSRLSYVPRVLDPLLRDVADNRASAVIVADAEMRWLYHPYDGGADAIAATSHGRDLFAYRYRDWLSPREDEL